MRVTAESKVSETIKRYPSTGDVFTQHGRLYAARPRDLYASYPDWTVAEWAERNGVALDRLLRLLDAAAESEEAARRDAAGTGHDAWRERTPPIGSIGYTGSYGEPPETVDEVPVVWVLDARGPD